MLRQYLKALKRRGLFGPRGMQQRFGLLSELFEIGTLRQRLRRHDDLHAVACGSQSGSTDGWTCSESTLTVGLALRANLQAPGAHLPSQLEMASGVNSLRRGRPRVVAPLVESARITVCVGAAALHMIGFNRQATGITTQPRSGRCSQP